MKITIVPGDSIVSTDFHVKSSDSLAETLHDKKRAPHLVYMYLYSDLQAYEEKAKFLSSQNVDYL
jgi:hypothetical protein